MEATKRKLLVGDDFLSDESAWFNDGFDVFQLYSSHFSVISERDVKENPSLCNEVEGMVAFTMLSRIDLSNFPKLKMVCHPWAGVDLIIPFFPTLRKRGIRLVCNPNVISIDCADLAIALLLSTARLIARLHKSVTERNEHNPILGRPVTGATIGIVGLGNIGSAVAQRAKGFDMNVLYNTRTRRPEIEKSVGASHYSSLHEMLPLCDFVVIACPLTKDTHNLVTKKEFALMKPTSILINIARGKIVNTDDLVAALKSGQIWGAGLDVTDPEPLPAKHPLKELDRVILTPHSGGAVPGMMEKAHKGIIKGILAYLKDGSDVPEVTVVDMDKYT